MAQPNLMLDRGHDLIIMGREAVEAAEALLVDAGANVRSRVAVDRKIVDRVFVREQRAAHGLAWLATYVEAVRQLVAYADRMYRADRLGEIDLVTQDVFIDVVRKLEEQQWMLRAQLAGRA